MTDLSDRELIDAIVRSLRATARRFSRKRAHVVKGQPSGYLVSKRDRGRVSKVHVPAAVDVRAIRRRLKLSESEFARRYALPLALLRKWEQGARKPDAVTRAYLTLIARNPRVVVETPAAT